MSELIKVSLKNLDCANCANKIENKVNSLEKVKEANLNFSLGIMSIEINEEDKQEILNNIKDIVHSLEPGVVVKEIKKAEKPITTVKVMSLKKPKNEFKLKLKGLDCANCANKIEDKVKEIAGIKEAWLNFSLGLLRVSITDGASKEFIIKNIKQIVNKLEPSVVVTEFSTMTNVNIGTDEHDHHEKCNDSCCTIEAENTIEEEKNSFWKENISLIVGIVMYIAAIATKDLNSINIYLFFISYILVGKEVIIIAIKNIFKGEIFDENFLMSIATIGALCIGEYPEAVAVMIFYQIGELFQSYAVNKSRKSITSLMNIKADYANVLVGDKEKKVSPESVEIDEIILIKPGEKVPLDGIIVDGEGSLDTSALTGESIPREVKKDEEILSGSINLNSVLKVKVIKKFSDSTVSRILEMVENASSKKAKTEKFITKFCKYYTPIVVALAICIAILPPIIMKDSVFYKWIYRALSFLVVSCPCALVVSIPLGLFSGIGGASKKGVLVKGGNYLEALKDVDTIVFDKTGTLTKGTFKVSEINSNDISTEQLLKVAAIGESLSNHPIAQSIVKEYGEEINKEEIQNYEELSGYGVKAIIENKETLLGNYKLMKENQIECEEITAAGTIVYIAVEGKYKGSIVIEDEIKESSKEAIIQLKSLGVNKIVMLTGDNKVTAKRVAEELGINEVYGELLPGDKVTKVEELIKTKGKGNLIFVGDGINDAPVLARADIGVAMGGIGSDAAIEAADVVLMKDNPLALVEAINIGRKTSKILWQNIVLALVIKVGVLVLISFGIADMWQAVFADVGVTLLAVLNSMRALK
ncbi:MAG: cadmium-translocating P-type ATPase [Clostridium butyricum]|nr:cadmium-translocating P-type ATPase [Clostridium butyricum]